MEALIQPEIGLMFWTVVCFGLLALLLSKTAWKPPMQAVEERERAIKNDRASAESARAEAEKIKTDLEAQLASLKGEVQRRLDEARATAERERGLLVEEARKSASLIVETAKREIDAQRLEAARDLRHKVSELSVLAAERILLHALDHRANTDLASRYLAELEKEKPELSLEKN